MQYKGREATSKVLECFIITHDDTSSILINIIEREAGVKSFVDFSCSGSRVLNTHNFQLFSSSEIGSSGCVEKKIINKMNLLIALACIYTIKI